MLSQEILGENLFLASASFSWLQTFLGLWLHHFDFNDIAFSSVCNCPLSLLHRTLALGPTWIIQKKLLNLIDLSRIPKDPFPYKVTQIPGNRSEVLEAIIQKVIY